RKNLSGYRIVEAKEKRNRQQILVAAQIPREIYCKGDTEIRNQ
uniref:Uncharacterized protein n=1 Tax=Anopheles atroparvus TaxID=41427 RepID=A0AAG5DSA9_ANOAO